MRISVVAFSILALFSSWRTLEAQDFSRLIETRLSAAGITAEDLNGLDATQLPSQTPLVVPNSTQFSAVIADRTRLSPARQQALSLALAGAIRESAVTAASAVGHGGAVAIAEGSLAKGGGDPLVKGLFCRMFCGKDACGPIATGHPDPAQCKRLSDLAKFEDAVGKATTAGNSPIAQPLDTRDAENPAGYTFLGQMIDHDFTATLVALGNREVQTIVASADDTLEISGKRIAGSTLNGFLQLTAEGRRALKSASGSSVQLDLENVYRVSSYDEILPNKAALPWFELDGSGIPTGKFLVRQVTVGGLGLDGFDFARKPKDADGKEPAQIGDGRNDENRLIAQIQALFMVTHNQCIAAHQAGSPKQENTVPEIFDTCMKNVRAVFQTIVLTDFLPRIMHPATLAAMTRRSSNEVAISKMMLPDPDRTETPLYTCHLSHSPGLSQSKMPFEFAVAGFRLGHSLLRNDYDLHTGVKKRLFQPEGSDQNKGLLGNRALSMEDVIDWSLFFETVGADGKPSPKPQKSQLLDPLVANVVHEMPIDTLPMVPKAGGAKGEMERDTPDERNLPRRNFLRSFERGSDTGSAGIVSGERAAELARAHLLAHPSNPKMPPITKHSAADLNVLPKASYATGMPLWLYILAEGEKEAKGMTLGPLGSQIVGGVILGTSRCDGRSVVHTVSTLDTTWPPTSQILAKRRYAMPDLIAFLQSNNQPKLKLVAR